MIFLHHISFSNMLIFFLSLWLHIFYIKPWRYLHTHTRRKKYKCLSSCSCGATPVVVFFSLSFLKQWVWSGTEIIINDPLDFIRNGLWFWMLLVRAHNNNNITPPPSPPRRHHCSLYVQYPSVYYCYFTTLYCIKKTW